MYINPFVAGVVATVLFEVLAVFLVAIVAGRKK